ncbi:MAG: helix-turn-helix domain containing protein [Hydrococcus sp. C42_A2020_068]|uniref:helix-turn-helix domain-containing protein n=1 Tax=Pleurocapsa sp. PCC 7327 TaxID=118163 RepID=UPI00029FF92A|nr:helix-turn-helix domain-containing protein [Pleurocapsa sp. PCC 7327]AFY78104.1 transposase [Pleurocapsa sp. PCC 7327]MBF2020223.1 helix-turn-helix domain containing protein [Hydrococcus sp. C42_A2020_068]
MSLQKLTNYAEPIKLGTIAVKQQDRDIAPELEKLILDTLSQQDLRPEHRRRLEIVLRTEMGQSQAEICAALGCSQDTARYWMSVAQTGQIHNVYDHPIGRPKTVNQQYLDRLQELVSHSPQNYGYSFKRWTAQWLRKHLAKELGIEVSDRHINRLLKQMGLSTRKKDKRSTKPSWRKGSSIIIADLDRPSSVEFDK